MNISLEFLTPNTLRSESGDAQRRARAVLLVGGMISLIASYISWVQLAHGSRLVGSASLVLAVLAAGGAELTRRTGHWQPVGVGICISIFIVAASIVGISGGTMPAASFYLALVPVITTVLFGLRAGAVVVVLNIAYLSAVELMRRNGFEFPLFISEEIIAQSAYRGAMIFEAILFAMALVYEFLRRANLIHVLELESRYEALSSQNTDLVFEIDTEGIIRHSAEEHAAALGWTASDLIGHQATDFLHNDEHPSLMENIETTLREGSVSAADIRLLHSDGSWHWYEPSLTAFKAPDSKPRLLVIARNVEDRLRAEMQQRQSHKMDAVGQLASGIAHDFNNLLMVVGSYAQMLADELPPGDQRKAAEEIFQASEQGEALTRQLVAVSRPGNHSLEPTDPNEVIRRAMRILTKIAGDRVSVELSLQADLCPVISDAGHLDQILVNLTVNARDAMPDGGVLHIKTSNTEDHVLIQVADTGIGIPPDAKDRIFEAFFTTKSRQHGTGLGLYVVYTLIQEMDGSIDVHSVEGAGTTLTISLPAVRDRAATAPMTVDPAQEVKGGNETILLVEDRDQLRDIVGHMLQKAGYSVIGASNGQEGLDRARSHDGPIHLVLSDVVMPEMNGPEMARILRNELNGTRFLFMSGHPERARELAEELSEDRLILKPIVPPELLHRIRDALDRAGPKN